MVHAAARGTRLASLKLREGGVRLKGMATRSVWCPILILLLLIGDGGLASSAAAQTASPPPPAQQPATTPPPQDPPPALPVDLSRIRGGLKAPVRVRIDDGRVRFFAEAVAPGGPSFKELTVNFDLRNGPVPGAGMTHSEFLSMVTPQELYGSGGIKPLETLQWGIVNAAGWWAIRKLYKELNETIDERRKNEIRKQIDRELAALRGK
jgi:hypothetical protein